MSSSIACPLCNKKKYRLLVSKPHGTIVRCENDGLVFVNPQPTPQALDRMYNENYFASKGKRTDSSIGYHDYLSERPLLLPYFRRKIALLSRYLRGKKVLEIGSSYGFFLEEARRAHLDILGIDLSREAVAYARKRGLPARAVDLFEAKFRSNSFDGVVAFHLIEHVRNPVEFMREVYRVTKPGGVVLLATPKLGGYLERMMGNRWFSYRHKEHLYFFSKESMTVLLRKTGWRHIECFGDETRWYPVHFLLRAATYFYTNTLWQSLLRLGEVIFHFPPLSYIQVPFPLDTLLVLARK